VLHAAQISPRNVFFDLRSKNSFATINAFTAARVTAARQDCLIGGGL
jgi:hypothetical protein